MPPYSTLKTFVQALQTGRTNITECLERYFNNFPAVSGHPHFADLQQPGAVDRPMPAWARQVLRGAGMSDAEVSHIDRWPDGEKEKVRAAVVDAVQNTRRMRFAWELTGRPPAGGRGR